MGCGALRLYGAIRRFGILYLVPYRGWLDRCYLSGRLHLFFLGYFKLIFKGKDHERAFNVFGGTVGKCIVAGIGLLLTVFALIVSFFPPSQLDAQSGTVYVATLIICWVVSVAIPFVVYALRKHWNGGIDHNPPTIPSKKMLAAAAATSSSAPAPAKSEPAQKQAASADAHSSDSPPKEQS